LRKATIRRPAAEARIEGLEDDSRELYLALQELLRVYQFRERDRACYGDISVNECYALETIDRLGPRTVVELASALNLHKSNACRMAQGLEEKGLLERRRHPSHPGMLQLDLTREGRRVHLRIRDTILASQRALLAAYGRPVRKGMCRLLRELAGDAARRQSCKT